MGISSVLVSALAKMSIKTPTEIQAACIPPLLQGKSNAVKPMVCSSLLTYILSKAEIA